LGGVAIYQTAPIGIGDGPHVPYLGIAAIIAALLARPGVSPRSRVLFYTSAIASVVILLKLFGLPPVQWAGYLPILRQIHFAHYFGLPLGFLLTFLSALGMDSLLRGRTTAARALCATALAIVAIESLWWVARSFHVLQSPVDSYWIRDLAFLTTLTWLTTMVLLTGTFVPRLRKVAVALLLTAMTAEGMFNDSYQSPTAWDIFKHPPPYVQTLQREAGIDRVLAFAALNANLNSAFGIFSVDSLMATNPPRMHDLYMRYTGAPASLLLREARQIPPEAVLDRANIRFVLIRDLFSNLVSDAQARKYASRFDDGYVSLFERRTMPRFFFSSDYRVLPPSEALREVATAASDEILLEEQPAFRSSPNAPGDPAVHVDSYHRNSVTVSVVAPRAGFVYASESFFDGWTAKINGRPARILPANYAFRALAVAAGSSHIEFRYWPPGLTAGLGVSGVSVVLLFAFAVWSKVEERGDGDDERRRP
jgi:hypothetical protein